MIKIFLLARRNRMCFFFGLALILFFLYACATTHQSKDTGKKSSGNIEAELETQAEAKKTDPIANSNTTSAKQFIKITHQDEEQTEVLITVPEKIQVSPRYNHPELVLSFSSPIDSGTLPDNFQDPIIRKMHFKTDNSSDQAKSVVLELKQKIRFLISRDSPRRLKILLSARKDSPRSSIASSKSSQYSSRLKDIAFTRDKEDKFYIKLHTSSETEYRPQPSKGKKVQFLFPGLYVPDSYEKLYNLGKFNSPLQSVELNRSPDGGRMLLAFSRRVPFNIEQKGNSLIFSFSDFELTKSAESSNKAQSSEQIAAEQIPASNNQTAQNLKEQAETLFPGMKEEYTGKRISLDMQDADVEHVLRLIARVAGYNLVLSQDVQGKISLKLDNVPWDQALDIVLKQMQLEKVRTGNILRVMSSEQYQKEQQLRLEKIKARQKARQSRQELAPLETEYIQVNYTKASNLQDKVRQFISKRGKVSYDERTNQLIVSDTSENISKIKSVVQKLDRAERQVLIEARLVFATDTFQRSLGIKWGGGYESTHQGGQYNMGIFGTKGSTTAASAADPSGFVVNLPAPQQGETFLGIGGFLSKLTGTDMYTLDAQLSLGETKNLVKTISSPRVVTLNNQQAEVTQGTKIATQGESESGGTTTEYVEATLKLTVTPQITPDDKVILDLEITDDSPIPGGGDDIETRTASTQLIVDNKETIVLGGVHQITETESQDNIPGLSKAPLLGWLFKNKLRSRDKRELLIFIRPKIL